MKITTALMALCSLLWALPAAGQHTSPWDMNMPPSSVAGCNGPLCLAYNPSGLAWSPKGEFVYLHAERWGLADQTAGGADALMFATDRFGFSIQYVRLDSEESEFDYIKYNLMANFFKLGNHFSVGGGIEILDPTETDEDLALDYLAGVMVRPWRYVSLGVVGRNLAGAGLHGLRTQRSLDLGLALRPLWFAPERLTIAADYRFVETIDDPPLRFSLQANLFEGIGLFGTADLDGGFGLGIRIDFLRFGAAGYTHFGSSSDVPNQGMVFMASASLENKPGLTVVRDRTVELTLSARIANQDRPARGLFTRKPTLRDVELAIREATYDERIDSMLIKVEPVQLSITRVQELREAIAGFREAGKKVAFHLESATNLNYYLASIGDAIYLSPAGSVMVTGPRVEALFFGGSLEMIGVQAEAARVGKYKSAVEAFTREEPSPAHLEVMNSLADEYADQIFTAIADGRGLQRDQVEVLVDQGLMRPAQAEEAGLVDGVMDYDELDKALTTLLGHPSKRLRGYLSQSWHQDRWGSIPTVAIVHATGSISYGGQRFPRDMNARQIATTLKHLASSTSVDAVVLRIDSPGGSGLASDLIWRQLKLLRKRKPVIVSMGAMAASGGYYIACPADWILADPATITGSIGAFALLFDASELYARLGVSREVVGRGKLSDLYTSFRGRTPQERELLQDFVNDFYKGFVDRVAEGRKMDPTEVDKLAQGRVWTGRQAKQHGLVDELGGLSRALALAKERIGLAEHEDIRVIHLPRVKPSLFSMLREVGIMAEEQPSLPGLVRTTLQQLATLAALSTEPILALLPVFSLQVK
jgi:protease-4